MTVTEKQKTLKMIMEFSRRENPAKMAPLVAKILADKVQDIIAGKRQELISKF